MPALVIAESSVERSGSLLTAVTTEPSGGIITESMKWINPLSATSSASVTLATLTVTI